REVAVGGDLDGGDVERRSGVEGDAHAARNDEGSGRQLEGDLLRRQRRRELAGVARSRLELRAHEPPLRDHTAVLLKLHLPVRDLPVEAAVELDVIRASVAARPEDA